MTRPSMQNQPTHPSMQSVLQEMQKELQTMCQEKTQSDMQHRSMMNNIMEVQNRMATTISNLKTANRNLQTKNEQLRRQVVHQQVSSKKQDNNVQQTHPTVTHSAIHQPKTDQSNPDVNNALLQLVQLNKMLVETRVESSVSKFPKIQGKLKAEFKTWFDQVLAILATPTWKSVSADMSKK